MKAISISKKKFESLEKLPLPNHILNTEAELYILPIKNKWEQEDKLLKRYYIDEGFILGNKLLTINTLIDSREKIDIEEIVFPERLAIVNEQVIGYTMPLINSINLQSIYLKDNIDPQRKIDYLKQVGKILEKMKMVREYTDIKKFYLNDMHESNFIIETSTDKVKVIDIDSCKINKNYSFGSKYLSHYSLINGIQKYKKEEEFSCGGYFIPSEDTDLYCYIIMILNLLSGTNMNKISLDNFYEYLDYLYGLGIDKYLIDIFEKVLSNCHNENPYELLDILTPYIGRTNYNTYLKVRKK